MRKIIALLLFLTAPLCQILAQPNYQEQMRATGKPGHDRPVREYGRAVLNFTSASMISFGYTRPNFKSADFGMDRRNGFTAGTAIVIPFMNPYNLERGLANLSQVLGVFTLKLSFSYTHSKIIFSNKDELQASSLDFAPLLGNTLLSFGPYMSRCVNAQAGSNSAFGSSGVFTMPRNDFGLRLSTRLIFINAEFSWGLKKQDYTRLGIPMSARTRSITLKFEI